MAMGQPYLFSPLPLSSPPPLPPRSCSVDRDRAAEPVEVAGEGGASVKGKRWRLAGLKSDVLPLPASGKVSVKYAGKHCEALLDLPGPHTKEGIPSGEERRHANALASLLTCEQGAVPVFSPYRICLFFFFAFLIHPLLFLPSHLTSLSTSCLAAPAVVWVTIGILASNGFALQLKLKRNDQSREKDKTTGVYYVYMPVGGAVTVLDS